MPILDWYVAIMAGLEAPVVLEIGCAGAEETAERMACIRGKPFDYFAFECDIENIEKVKASPVYADMHFIPRAVGDRDGVSTFYPTGPNWKLSGSVKEPVLHPGHHPWIQWKKPEEVGMLRLDSFMRIYNIGHIDFIWCDVQGAEDLVIAGGQEALKRTDFLYTEYYNTEEYKGQIGRDEIQKRLPGTWELAHDFDGHDALFHNLR